MPVVRLDPNDSNSLISQVRLAIDGETKMLLRVQVFGTDNKIVFEVAYTSVDFTRPDDSEFLFNPPPGAKVTERMQGQNFLGDGVKEREYV